MARHTYALFETPLGPCGLVWSPRGLAGVQLPEASPHATRARVQQRFPGAEEAGDPWPPVPRRARDGILALLAGERPDLSGLPLDMDHVPPFHRRVYEEPDRSPRPPVVLPQDMNGSPRNCRARAA